jgi:formamidopyrimidine-DNA glycosylase
MPELPEVETVCRGLAETLIGKRIVKVEQHRPDLRAPMPKGLGSRLMGKRVMGVTRRAKYILIGFDGGEILMLHLGMSGRLLITSDAEGAGKHDHLVFHFENNACLRFNDPRRFGLCDLARAEELPRHTWLKHLGVEPLGREMTPAWLRNKFKGKTTSIKTALMDQRQVVGIGNIYASEALFYAGISPKRLAGACSPKQLAKLAPAIRKVLKAAIAAGGSSLRDYRQTNGELGYFQHSFAVYGREGKACPGCACDPNKTGGIRRIAQSGRSSFYCPRKQV